MSWDSDFNAIDNSTLALNTISYPHHEVHSGSSYILTRDVTLGVAADDEIRIQTPNTTKWLHFWFTAISDDVLDIYLYESTSLTHVAGNVLTPINRNRNSSNTSGATICHTPAGAGDGNLIFAWGAGSNAKAGGSIADTREEFVLKQNTAYLFRASGANGDLVTIVFEWYEHTDKL